MASVFIIFFKSRIILKKTEFGFESHSKMTNESWKKFYHRLVETFKHVFSKRHLFGDESFVDMTDVGFD